ncbi:MAG: 3-hydroxyacyl-ACP dehydratase FabZ family protein [Limisphaerales bacterium]|jgi:3-hydroxyacyl-[acyl-carrier-protein] dehydratase
MHSVDEINQSLDEILPHGQSFRFITRVIAFAPATSISAELDLEPSAPYFAGHFPGNPLMPGVLMTEALAQTSGLLLALTETTSLTKAHNPPRLFHLAASQMKFSQPVKPGVTLSLLSRVDRDFGGLIRCHVEAAVHQTSVASGVVTLATVTPSP